MRNSQGIADLLAQYGRGGDNRLVHMSDAELRGLASLAPNGQLPINPVTGQPEAFSLKKILQRGLPIAAGMAATAATGGAAAPLMAPWLAGGLATGATTGVIEGDLKRGIMAGVMGAGMGATLGAAGMTDPVLDSAGQAAITGPGVTITPLGDATASTFGERLMAPFQKGSGLLAEIKKPEHILPMAIGASQLSEYDAQDKWKAQSDQLQGDRDKEEQAVRARIRQMHMLAQPGAFKMAGGGITGIKQMDGGGYLDDDGEWVSESMDAEEVKRLMDGLRGSTSVAPTDPRYRPGFDPEFDYFQNDPENIQNPTLTSAEAYASMYRPLQRLRDAGGNLIGRTNYFNNNSMVPAWGNTANGDASNYVQLPDGSWVYDATGAETSDGGDGDAGFLDQAKTKMPASNVMAAGGDVQLNTGMGPAQIAGGGIANIPTEATMPQQPQMNIQPPMTPPPPQMAQPQAGGQPSDQDIQMLAMALTGQAGENADQIIQVFVQKFGPEMFQEARDFILKTMGGQNAQTEGMIKGQGGGMSDEIGGTIGGQQPVAVSPGEYILPADIVSSLGDGSSDAGAAELDKMAENIRMAKGGRTTQPPSIDARQYLPY